MLSFIFYLQVLSRPLDREYVRLLQDVHAEQIPGHIYRGYTIITKNNNTNHLTDFQVIHVHICYLKIHK